MSSHARLLCAVLVAALPASGACGGDDEALAATDATAGDTRVDVSAGDVVDADVHDHSRDVPDTNPPPYTGPKLLSETGLYSDLPGGVVGPGIMPFDVR